MRVLIDDAGDIPAEEARRHNITVLPVNIMFGTEQYLSGVEMDHATFYRKAQEVRADNWPKTSQPTPFQFVGAYQKILAEGEKDILTITVSEKLSGTYASAVAAARELDGQGNFHLFDSQSGSAVMGYMAIEAARLAEDGATVDQIMARLEAMRASAVIVLMIDSLEYAVRGGRVSSLRGTVASLLNIKPIMQVKDGLIVEAGKVRTKRKALEYMVDFAKQRVGDRPVKIAVLHAGAPEEGQALLARVRESFNVKEELSVDLAVAVAINLGPGAVGLVAIPD